MSSIGTAGALHIQVSLLRSAFDGPWNLTACNSYRQIHKIAIIEASDRVLSSVRISISILLQASTILPLHSPHQHEGTGLKVLTESP